MKTVILNWHISRGMIICTFEKGMSLNQAWDYARHIQVRDTTGRYWSK